jgi:hypothetical protein
VDGTASWCINANEPSVKAAWNSRVLVPSQEVCKTFFVDLPAVGVCCASLLTVKFRTRPIGPFENVSSLLPTHFGTRILALRCDTAIIMRTGGVGFQSGYGKTNPASRGRGDPILKHVNRLGKSKNMVMGSCLSPGHPGY